MTQPVACQLPGDPRQAFAPPAATWLRKGVRTNLQFLPGKPVVVGVLQWEKYATNCDVILDFAGATVPASGLNALVVAAIDLQGMSGSGKVYRAQFAFQPSNLVVDSPTPPAPSAFPSGAELDPSWSWAQTMNQQQMMVHAGGIGGLVWGLEIGIVSATAACTIANMWAVGIAHGREIGAIAP